MKSALQKRISALEAQAAAGSRSSCNFRRRLAKYQAWFSGQPWECRNPTPENIRRNEEKLARYKKYFDDLERCSG
jgi:hypothetical protein